MNNKPLNEAEICDAFITPAIIEAGWDQSTQVRREYTFTDGRVIVRGKLGSRGKKKRADYLLFYQPNLPLAVVEAKDNSHPVGGGMQQALGYAEALDVPFVFSSNGDAFLFHDRTGQSSSIEKQIGVDKFPSPDELWRQYRAWKGLDEASDKLARQPYADLADKAPRYYQRVAVQRAVEAIARGQRRVLLVMATGTGKTFSVFQIIWRLWKAEKVKRVLFLVDRNILADQTVTNDFKPFGPVMTKVRNRDMDPSYEIYIALYQAVSGSEEEKNVYRQFSREFFDLVVIDECHRGSAREASAWREILNYFEPAIQLGLTATPKETTEVSTLSYFGDPIYAYSLKEGIDDGFLAPFKVVRIDLDKDLQGWRPPTGMTDDLGQEIEDRIYNQRDMDQVLVLNERTRRIAEKVVAYLLETDPYGKTIVFCENIPADMRKQPSRYISRGARDITSEGLNRSSAQMLPIGSVLFSSRAPIGHVGIAANSLSTNQGFKSCVPYIPAMSEYLYIFLRQAGPDINAQATGTTFKEISGKDFALISIPTPPLAEQHRIVAKVDELMGLIDRLEQHLVAKREYHEAFAAAAVHHL